jgi:S1-C subfamily serine protease
LDIVHGDLLDLVLIVIAVGFAVSGYRQGFIVGTLSFVGFVGGAVLGAQFGPSISHAIVGGQTQQDVVAVVLLISAAIIGQFVASSIGAYLRQSMTSPSSTTLDAIGGAAVSVLSMLLTAWAIASVLTASSFQGVVSQVNDSAVLTTMDKIMPSQAKTMFGDFRRLLATGPFPQVFSGIGAAHLFAISAPDPAVLNSPGYQAAVSRVVKVQGTALSCDRLIEGSGFVFAPDHVMTNAHVVGGVSSPTVQIGGVGQYYHARVVLYDPETDIAVLYVPGLNAPSLQFDTSGKADDDGVVAGFPEDGSFTAVAARIRQEMDAQGQDIYDQNTVTRDIFSLYSTVLQGNSGGPLLTPDGEVYGVVFAKSLQDASTGYALTADQVQQDAQQGADLKTPVDTRGCAV